jgi:hypothetical protein
MSRIAACWNWLVAVTGGNIAAGAIVAAVAMGLLFFIALAF